MSLVFLNGWLAPLLALAAVPVLVHLFARSRPRRVVFSSLRFLEPVVKRNLRMKRPKMWVLLVLRTLAVLALMLAFLLPVLPSILPQPEAGARRNVVLVIDSSASMGALEGPRTRMAAAAAQADGILGALGSGARANIIFARAESEPVFPGLVPNIDALRDAARSGKPAPESADMSAALAMATGMLADVEGTRELVVLSDFQASAWQDVVVPDLADLEVVALRCAAETVPNQGLVSATVTPHRVLAGGAVEVLCEVANFSDEPVLRTIFLRAGEVAQSREVRVGPWSTAGAAFELRLPSEGEHAIELSTDEDAFPVDNRRWLTVEAAPHLVAWVVGKDTRIGSAWSKACDAIEWIAVESPGDSDLVVALDKKRPDVILVADGRAKMAEALSEYAQSGGAVIIAPTPGENALWLTALIGASDGVATWETMPEPGGFAVTSVDHPALAVFESGRFGEPAGGRAQGRQRLDPTLEGALQRVISYQDGVAAIAAGREMPNVILWNVADEMGSWHERTELVPLLGELVLHTTRQSAAHEGFTHASGTALRRTFDEDLIEEDLEVVAGNAAFSAVRVDGMERTFAIDGRTAPGIHEWRYLDSRIGLDAVNLPSRESDLRVMNEGPLLTESAVALEAGASLSALQDARPLWPWLIGFAMVAVCLEGGLAWRFRESN